MNRVACAALLSTLLALSAAGQSVNWSQGIVYEYDGSGNVKKIGTDTYVYDTGQRLIRGSVAGSQQSYSYDSFGNRTGCQSGAGADCQYGLTILSSTNRVAGRDYDKRGNMEQLPENNTLDYDELGMVRKETGNQRQAYFIYTADDERIAVYDADTQFNSHTWRWTVRGLDKKPLRELTSETSSGTVNFKWTKDQIWRDSVLLASRQLDPTASGGVSTYHYHVDHLGTPRQVTSSAAILIGRHDYLPFGPEVSGNQSEPQPQTLKFTGHERDAVRDRPPLDYMHARYYEGRVGRFLSVDPGRDWDTYKPQSWNAYVYVRNNPINAADPTGRYYLYKFLGQKYRRLDAGVRNTVAIVASFIPYAETGQDLLTASTGRDFSGDDQGKWGRIAATGGLVLPIGGKLIDEVGEQVVKTARKRSSTIRKEWEAANGQSWPKDTATGANQDVAHKDALADGGTNELDNIEPKPHDQHMQEHKDNGDFKRWGSRRSKKPEDKPPAEPEPKP